MPTLTAETAEIAESITFSEPDMIAEAARTAEQDSVLGVLCTIGGSPFACHDA